MNSLIIFPDGSTTTLTCERGSELEALRPLMLPDVGGWNTLSRFPEAFYALDHYGVWHLDDWLAEAANPVASRMIGLDTEHYAPLRGPVALIPLPDGVTNREEREHQRRYFGVLDAVATGFCTADEAGIGALIDARALPDSAA